MLQLKAEKVNKMLSYFKQSILLPLLLIFLLLFDGSLIVLLSYMLSNVPYIISSGLLVMSLILLTIYLPNTTSLFYWSFVVGFIYDTFYTSIIGINLFAFPAIILITQYIAGKLPLNFYSIWFYVLVLYTLYHHVIYLLYRLLDIHQNTLATFWSVYFLPSLLFNGLMAFLLIWLIRQFVLFINK